MSLTENIFLQYRNVYENVLKNNGAGDVSSDVIAVIETVLNMYTTPKAHKIITLVQAFLSGVYLDTSFDRHKTIERMYALHSQVATIMAAFYEQLNEEKK